MVSNVNWHCSFKVYALEVQLKIFSNLDMNMLTKHGNVVKTITWMMDMHKLMSLCNYNNKKP
jgi:hypothetical protein